MTFLVSFKVRNHWLLEIDGEIYVEVVFPNSTGIELVSARDLEKEKGSGLGDRRPVFTSRPTTVTN